jgi:hypothetical protein
MNMHFHYGYGWAMMKAFFITGGDHMTVLFALVFFALLALLAPRHGVDSRDSLDNHSPLC